MSRIGRLPISVPSGVEVKIDGSLVTVKGPKGEHQHEIAAPITAVLEDAGVTDAVVAGTLRRDDGGADRFLASRAAKWQDHDEHGRPLRRTMGIASLGGATLDNEENYLIKKLFTAAGAIQIENQARI